MVMAGAGVARRVDAGRAAQGVHLQARVVREARQAGALEEIGSLLQGVLLQGFPRLGNLLGDARLRERNDLEIRAEHLRCFAEFAGVGGGENDLHNGGKVSTKR